MTRLIKKIPFTGFSKDENGSTTILSLYFLLIFLVVGGLAIDFNKAMSERTQLQVATDTAAHAALYTREEESIQDAKIAAMNTIDGMLPEHQFGLNPLLDTDVAFGSWDFAQGTFVESNSSRSAVRVRAEMSEARNNPSRNILLAIVGQETFDISVESVYSTYYPPCFNEGFVAEEVVDIQSNNSFFNGFCIHSNEYVSLNQNNFFEPGTIVSMPNLDNLDVPNSGFERNEGLQAALRSGQYRMRLLNKLPDIINSFWTADPEHLPDYVYPVAPYDISMADVDEEEDSSNGGKKGGNDKSLTPQHFVQSAVNFLYCSGSGKITMKAGVYSNFVFISDCEVKFANGVVLEDVVVATTNTSANSLNSPSGLQIGRLDNCAPGGGATLMTLGGFSAASSLSAYNGQILAIGDIDFAANANGIQGVSFISQGTIDGTSNMDMGFCDGQGMEDIYRAPYFRMVN